MAPGRHERRSSNGDQNEGEEKMEGVTARKSINSLKISEHKSFKESKTIETRDRDKNFNIKSSTKMTEKHSQQHQQHGRQHQQEWHQQVLMSLNFFLRDFHCRKITNFFTRNFFG